VVAKDDPLLLERGVIVRRVGGSSELYLVVKEEDIWNRPSSQAVKSRLDGMLEQSREISESGGDMVRSAP